MSAASRSEERVLTPQVLRDWPLPEVNGGKAARGTVLVVGGSRATPGAVLLAGVAALRAGAGVLQLAVAESTATALSIQVPEAMVVGLPETGAGAVSGRAAEPLADLVAAARVLLVGPGLSDVDATGELLRRLLDAADPQTQVVLDAYALGALSRDPELTRTLTRPAVLTPNAVEGAILLGESELADLGKAAGQIADAYQTVTTLYGRVAAPAGTRWRDESGDTGLGTSGSGDVLGGVIAGLLARGATAEQAACWGSYVHAVAGQRLIPRFGRVGYLARELLDEVPCVIAELTN